MPGNQLCISADSHVVEPPELFTPLEKRFGEQAPRVRFFEDRGPHDDEAIGGVGVQGPVHAGGNRQPMAPAHGTPGPVEGRGHGAVARPIELTTDQQIPVNSIKPLNKP